MDDRDSVDSNTKLRWDENWRDISMEKIMGIFDYPRVKEQLGYFFKYIKKDGIILEGGCGLAPYVIHLTDMGYNIVGLDYNLSPLKKAMSYRKAKLLVANVDKLPFENAVFDYYLSLGVIEHFVKGPQEAVKEAYRVLKPGGYFLCQVPARNIYRFFDIPLRFFKRNSFVRTMFGKPRIDYYWEQYFGKKNLIKILENAGFVTREVIRFSYSHALISSFPFLRKKGSYDAASDTAIKLASILKKFFPEITAGENLFIVQKGAD